MEFKQRTRGGSGRIRVEPTLSELAEKYPFAMHFFKDPPTGDVSLQEFEEFAVDRLKVLRHLEKAKLKYVKGTDMYRHAFYEELRKENLMGFCKKTPYMENDAQLVDFQDRRRDYVSHFILRLAFCKTEEQRRWLMTQEADLFAIRFYNEPRVIIKKWLVHNNMHLEPIPEDEKIRLHDTLRFNPSILLTADTDFYKVPFVDILELVSHRKVYLERGFAYIKIKDLAFIITSKFRTNMSQSLAFMARALPTVEEDARVTPLLKSLHLSYLGRDYSPMTGAQGHVTRHMLDGLSEKSFPLCMRQLHTALRQNHHLRHHGRLQYMLFLKGIGMSLEEVLQFWRDEFTRTVDPDKFDKQYGYSVRHSFGKEGKRANYTPYSCMKIITTSNPSTGDHHGCPFRHTDAVLLRQKLTAYKVNSAGVREIMDLVSSGHFQVACSRYFEVTQGTGLKQNISHPNQYFEESQKLVHGVVDSNKAPSDRSNEVRVTNLYATDMPSKRCDNPNEIASTDHDILSDIFTEDDSLDDIMASIE